ncbi:hypothetical protein BC829DRAFT_125051 [Chytridium lagenaria]|nr:hypothetical protein BC829DRAFT_125051 [Chytridium lagenaria]
MKSIILIASLLASPTLTFAFTPVYSRTPLNRREAPDIEDTTIIDCIEGFSTCGPLTSAGHGTIAICSEGYYRTSTTCSNGTTTSCRFVDGLPTCVAGIGEDGLYMDANSVAFDGLYTVSNAVEVERRSIEEREVEVVRRAGMEVGEVMLEVRQAKPTTRKPKRTPVGVSLGTMIARSVSSNTIYGQQGLSWCQYDIILKITSTFETGSQELGFGYCGNWNDGQGISAGFIQFTTSSGSVLLVVQSYLRRTSRSNPPSPPLSQRFNAPPKSVTAVPSRAKATWTVFGTFASPGKKLIRTTKLPSRVLNSRFKPRITLHRTNPLWTVLGSRARWGLGF